MNSISTYTSTPEATQSFAAEIAATLKPGDVVALIGELGAGKSCFVEGAVEKLHGEANTSSPSYTLVNIYEDHSPTIYHLDLYRLEKGTDLDEIGYDEFLSGNGITFVEWFDKIPESAPREYLEVKISPQEDGSREIQLRGFGARGEEILKELGPKELGKK